MARHTPPVRFTPAQALHLADDPERARLARSTDDPRVATESRRPGLLRRWWRRLRARSAA